MPGRYEHKIELNVDTSGAKARIDLTSPCEDLGHEITRDIAGIADKLNRNKQPLLSEIGHLSRNLQVSALNSYGSNKSGTLAGSITEEMGGNSVSIGTDLFYAQYVNDGRGSISAGDKVLHFFIDGEEVFVRSVGPSASRPYLDDSYNMLSQQIDAMVSQYISSI